MTHDDDEDRNLPALSRRPTPPAVASARDLLAAPAVNGIVQSAISGFMADMRRRSLQKHGQAVGAFADLQSERTRVVRNTIELASEVGRLEDLDNTLLAEQRARDEEREEAEHKRWLNARRRAREREQADFDDATVNADQQRRLSSGRQAATEAERLAQAATRVKDEQVEEAYLKALTSRLDAAYKAATSQDVYATRDASTASPSPANAYTGIIDLIQNHHNTWRERQQVTDAIDRFAADLIAQLKAERARS